VSRRGRPEPRAGRPSLDILATFSRICRSILSLTFHKMLLIAGTVAPFEGAAAIYFPPLSQAMMGRQKAA
jgi:hypothetical protein